LHELISVGQAWTTLVKEKLEKGLTVEELKQLSDEGAMLRIEVPQAATIQTRYEAALKWLDETKDVLTTTDIDQVQYEKWLNRAQRISLQHIRVDLIAERIQSAQRWRQSACSLFCKSAGSLPDALGLRYLVYEHLKRQDNRTSSVDGACLCQEEKPGWMVQCGFCDAWYHGQCIYVTKSTVGTNSQFRCPVCCKRKGVPYPFDKRSPKELPVLDDVLALLKEGAELHTTVSEFAWIKSIAEEAAQWKARAVFALDECALVELNVDADVRHKQTDWQVPRPRGDPMDVDVALDPDSSERKLLHDVESNSSDCSRSRGRHMHPALTLNDDDVDLPSSCCTSIEEMLFCDEEDAIPSLDPPAEPLRLAKEEYSSIVTQEIKIAALLDESRGATATL